MSGSSQTTQQSQSSQTSPWAPQANEIQKAFGYADTAYNKASQAQAPTDFTAQFTPDQLSTFQKMLGYSNSSSIPSQNAATGSALSSAGTGATAGALSNLAAWDPSRITEQNIADATATANSPYITDAVNAAMRDARQQVRDVTLPGIEASAAGSGNINSTRTGVAEGIVNRGLAQQTADTSATMRQNAFTDALNRSSSNIGNYLSGQLGTANAGTNAANAGVNASSGSIGDQTNLFNLANAGGAGQMASDQANLTNQQQQYQSKITSPFDALNQYMQIIGGQQWGSSTTGTGTSTTESTPSIWSVLGGLMSAGGSLLGAGKGTFSFRNPSSPTWSVGVGNGAGGLPFPTYR